MKFKFVCEHEEGDTVTHEFDKVLLSDVLMRMQDFLKGCGYVFDGTLDIIEDDAPSLYTYENTLPPTAEEKADIDDDGRC